MQHAERKSHSALIKKLKERKRNKASEVQKVQEINTGQTKSKFHEFSTVVQEKKSSNKWKEGKERREEKSKQTLKLHEKKESDYVEERMLLQFLFEA